MPFGVGRYVRAHNSMKRQLSTMKQQLSALERTRNERDEARSAGLAYADAYRRLAAELSGEPAKAARRDHLEPPAARHLQANLNRARTARDQAVLVNRLSTGEPLANALVAQVRRLLDTGDAAVPTALVHGLLADDATRPAGQLGLAVIAVDQGLWDLAQACFAEVPPETWRGCAAGDFFRTAFITARDAALAELWRLVAEPPGDLHPAAWVDLVGIAFGAQAQELAAELFDVAETLAGKEPDRWAATVAQRDHLRPWIDRVRRPSPPPTIPTGQVAFAVLGYQQPDRSETSTNLGDYVQTLASLGHLVRHQNIRFHGAPELASSVTELRERLRPELRLDTPARDVTLVPVHRDASTYCSIPEPTWMVAFGWYMQCVFGRFDFPFHPHLRPIFISFHCNRIQMLSPAAIEYLRAYAPIGCRDWTTVDMLLSAGVPAFFSGCLTTTLSTVFPDLAPADRPGREAPVAYVDVLRSGEGDALTQVSEEMPSRGLGLNLRRVMEMLETYRRRYSAVVTSRLHCYLPMRSLGVPVELAPRRSADSRFNGLADLDDAEFAAMRDRIQAKLAPVLAAILAGGSEEEVYAIWREVCADDVAAAQARRSDPPPMPPPSFDLAAACREIRSGEVATGPEPRLDAEVHVAMALDGNLTEQLRVVVQALVENGSRPLHLWVLCRSHGPADIDTFAKAFPEVRVNWLPCDRVDYGPIRGMLGHITVSTMDRLLLPHLLPELDRIVYHDLDALSLGDIAELYDWDLQGHPLAARSSVAGRQVSGFERVHRSVRRIRDPQTAYDLVRRVHARHAYDFRGFNAGILVLDLARMRADGFGHEFLGFVERYGMNDQEILNCYAGPHRAELPPEWNFWPAQERLAEPKLIHWAGPVKPWQAAYVASREVWAEYAERMARRCL